MIYPAEPVLFREEGKRSMFYPAAGVTRSHSGHLKGTLCRAKQKGTF